MRCAFAFLAFLAALAANAAAHDSRPLFISLEDHGETISLSATAPASIDLRNAPRIGLAAPCTEIARMSDAPLRQRAVYRCKADVAVITIDWPVFNPSVSTLVRVAYRSGETRTQTLDPAIREWRAPPAENFTGVAQSYFGLGVHHILGGIDHLLFLAGLLILARTPRRILITVTGFTLAHSLTLALVALGVMRVSVPAIEAVIALSIVFLASEIARGDRTTLAWRRPALVAAAFGLAHGAGFAAALGEIGLPPTEKIAALLFFNLGVEAGQLGVIAAIGLCALFAARLGIAARLAPHEPRAERYAAYALGVIAAYWFFGRLAAIIA